MHHPIEVLSRAVLFVALGVGPAWAGEVDSWADLGQGLAGSYQTPMLEGDGPLVANTTMTITLSRALEQTTAFLVMGLTNIDAPFKGGTLVPDPLLVLGLPTLGNPGVPSGIAFGAPVPTGIPHGTTLVFQYWIVDPAAPFGFAASNAIEGTTRQVSVELAEELDGMLSVAQPAATSLPIYSLQDFGTQTYVRNPDCWAASLDLTGLSPWNGTEGNRRAGTLVSPRHVVFAKHYQISPAPGSNEIVFVAQDGTVVTRTVEAVALPGGDTAVGVLDADVPPEIGFYKVLPSDWADTLWEVGGVPMLHLDQEEKALVRDMVALSDTSATCVHTNASSPLRQPFTETLIGGDSGNPGFVVIGGEPVLVLTHFTAASGPFYTAWVTEVNLAMTALGGGYTLTEFDLAGHVAR